MKQLENTSGPPGDNSSRERFLIEAFDRYERQLTAYALKFFGGPRGNLHAARDAVQFTFLKLCQQPTDQIKDRLLPWLYTVCRNRIFDEIKANQKRPQLNEGSAVEIGSSLRDPAEQFEIDDFLQRLPQLLNTLSESEKEVVELWSHGLKPCEIAEVIDKAAGTVRVMLHRGIKKLQRHPEVSHWLERATGHGDQSSDRTLKTTATTGESR